MPKHSNTLERYLRHLRFYGPEGILEVAEHDLNESEFGRLDKAVREARRGSKSGVRRRSR